MSPSTTSPVMWRADYHWPDGKPLTCAFTSYEDRRQFMRGIQNNGAILTRVYRG